MYSKAHLGHRGSFELPQNRNTRNRLYTRFLGPILLVLCAFDSTWNDWYTVYSKKKRNCVAFAKFSVNCDWTELPPFLEIRSCVFCYC